MKTNEELKTLRNEVEALNKKLADLTEDELAQVAGGAVYEIGTSPHVCPDCGCKFLHQQGPYILQSKTVYTYKCSECPWKSGYCY